MSGRGRTNQGGRRRGLRPTEVERLIRAKAAEERGCRAGAKKTRINGEKKLEKNKQVHKTENRFPDEVIKFVATVKPRRLLCGGEVKMANSFETLVACTTDCTIEIVRRKCIRIPSRPEIATNQKMLIAKRRATTAYLKLFLLVLQALISPSCLLVA
ncbi:hypothetical protein TNCT_435871 [Trichonephila clavata]|uniref:Uncharacterized protein n=1 Tax=Trichonephila clavata TaxID=2740835 RepID=A0A8X6F6S9_TRICU|nr:hypothetical protein TNCT_435871 [Trichonephila clavata]